jgi:hypothetical protein
LQDNRKRREHRHAKKRRLRRQALQVMLFVVIIATATYLLNTLFKMSTGYMPAVNEPKDLDRELLLKKTDGGTATPGPQRQPPPKR